MSTSVICDCDCIWRGHGCCTKKVIYLVEYNRLGGPRLAKCGEFEASNHQNAADPPIGGAAEIGAEGGESVPSRAGR